VKKSFPTPTQIVYPSDYGDVIREAAVYKVRAECAEKRCLEFELEMKEFKRNVSICCMIRVTAKSFPTKYGGSSDCEKSSMIGSSKQKLPLSYTKSFHADLDETGRKFPDKFEKQ